MTLPRTPLLAALLLAACGSGDNDRAAEPEQRASPSVAPAGPTRFPVPAVTDISLPGEYRVAGIDGAELNAPIGIAVSITGDTIEVAPCAGFAWTYTFANGRLDTSRIPVSADEPVCRVEAEVARAGLAMAAADRVRRTSSNGLEFSGGGRSVLLFSQ